MGKMNLLDPKIYLLKVDNKFTKFYTMISKNTTRVMAINIPHMYQTISNSIFPTLEKYLK